MQIVVLLYFISLLISLPGFISKAGYNLKDGIIPFYNIYLFLIILKISPILLIIISLGLILTPDRMFFATLMFVFLPFITADAFGKGKITAFFTLILPFVMYPYLAYSGTVYTYINEEANMEIGVE